MNYYYDHYYNCKNCCGKQGPPGESCCCKDSVLYALKTIKDTLETNATVYSFNSNVEGEIGDFYNDEVVKIGDTYVSICNSIFISFNVSSMPENLNPFKCNTADCCCNSGWITVLNELVGTEFPVKIDLDIEIIDNNNSAQRVTDVYGICNGIIWVKISGGGNEPYRAIPLCSIFSVSK